MPCKEAKARKLLRDSKAKIVNHEPFTIRLLFRCENKTQPIILGVDSGSEDVGLSAVSKDKELYSAEVKIRGSEIVKLLSERRQYRRSRRNRNTRYREQVENVYRILPVSKLIVEVASFDIQKIKNPNISGTDYQEGEMYGWNAREYVLWRDKHQCQGRSKCKNKILITHHIESRQTGGNAPNNLITLCKECHDDYHAGKLIKEFKRGQSFRHEVFMGIMRIDNNLEKSHRVDALCITGNVEVERSNE
ncbi:10314_t:CDS:2 [Funneliformis geosporum]|nr:10314_t:CDS:2 [Funneliformis geosporum]